MEVRNDIGLCKPVWNLTSGKTLTLIGRQSASFQLPVGYFGLSIYRHLADTMYSVFLYKKNTMNLSVCSSNVRGLGNKVKREQILTWLKSSNLTFLLLFFLQETHSGVNTHSLWEQEWGHEAYFSGNINNSDGVGILINPKVSYAFQKYT